MPLSAGGCGWHRAGSDSVTSDELLGSGEEATLEDQLTVTLWGCLVISRPCQCRTADIIGWHNLTHPDKQNRKSPCNPGGPASRISHTDLSRPLCFDQSYLMINIFKHPSQLRVYYNFVWPAFIHRNIHFSKSETHLIFNILIFLMFHKERLYRAVRILRS